MAGWAPLGWWPVALAAFATLYLLLRASRSAVEAAGTGACFAFGLHIAGHGWMFATLQHRVGLGLGMAMIAMAIYLIYLSAFIVLPAAVFGWANVLARRRKGGREIELVIAFAALMTLGEWARSLTFNGFTSLSLGYVFAGSSLNGFAPVGGLYLSSFIAYVLAALLAQFVPRTAHRSIGARRHLFDLTPAVLVLTLTPWLAWQLASVEWSRPEGLPLTYRLVQSNVPQAQKFDVQHSADHTRHLIDLITAAPATIVATPETAFTRFLNDLPPDSWTRLQRFSRQTSSNLFLGVATRSAASAGFNSVVEVTPETDGVLPRYDKRRLMPFGEYSPLGFGWFSASLSISLKDLTEGAGGQTPLYVNTKHGGRIPIGTLICQEDLIGRDARSWIPAATLILNPSNLAWFDDSIAIEQRLQIVQMRAAEVARPILRVANTGVTAHIDSHGTVLSRLAVRTEGTLAGVVQPMKGVTPYARYGDGMILFICVLSLLPVARVMTRSARHVSLQARHERSE